MLEETKEERGMVHTLDLPGMGLLIFSIFKTARISPNFIFLLEHYQGDPCLSIFFTVFGKSLRITYWFNNGIHGFTNQWMKWPFKGCNFKEVDFRFRKQ